MDLDPDRVGDVRRVQTDKYVNHEEIIQLVPNAKFSYIILDGMLHDYEGDVTLIPVAEGGNEDRVDGNLPYGHSRSRLIDEALSDPFHDTRGQEAGPTSGEACLGVS